jgi:choline dehydrogenase-like flavoprotein
MEFDPEIQTLYEGECVGLPMRVMDERRNRTLDAGRVRAFGGTTTVWSGLCIPLDPLDFEARAWIPDSGWPLTSAELEPWYRRAARVFDLDSELCDEMLNGSADGILLGLDRRWVRTAVWQLAWRLRFGEEHAVELRGAESVIVLLHANVVRLSLNEAGSNVEWVEIRSLAGQKGRVLARAFVLACGGIDNARLLLLSNDVQRCGLGNQHDLVGRFFTEHPRTCCGTLVPLDGDTRRIFDYTWTAGTERLRRGFALGVEIQKQQEVANCSIRLVNVPWCECQDATDALLENGRERGLIHLVSDVEQVPNRESRVSLSVARDALGLNCCRVDWRLGAIERRTVEVMTTALQSELERLSLARVCIGAWLAAPADEWAMKFHDCFHHLGTTRMSADPRQGVVNGQCRVHGVENLFVAGGSVFATAGHANPTFTIVALALRLADHLRYQLA